jgi:hypothetical protein
MTIDDSSDGDYAKDGLGSIVVQIHRVRVTGPWEGKLPPLTPKTESRPILIGEKAAEIDADHRVRYFPLPLHFPSNFVCCIDSSFAPPTALKKAVKPQTTEWIDPRNGPPYIEFTFHYRSRGLSLIAEGINGRPIAGDGIDKWKESQYRKRGESGDAVRYNQCQTEIILELLE